MAFTEEQFCRTRPYLFHLTDKENLPKIRSTQVLMSAANLMRRSHNKEYLRKKRSSSVGLAIDGMTVFLRDQQPLHAGNIHFDEHFSFEDLIQSLNERVYFWPGKANGPIDYGVRHFQRYESEEPVVIRVASTELFSENQSSVPLFCKYNSGSPRCTGGFGSPRGVGTFVKASDAEYRPSNVVEVTFENEVRLPSGIEIGSTVNGQWKSI